ncbi:LIC_11026 family protein [Leptospira sp. GIMC2001]|uniref:LIC_11026 family protein n=1 Tax=Leptospira sp. GIMC2001 TaxID=1513297 RepID=UPI00234BE90E|nr:hypothetical protein [Leptospira sp. GIMC2001]WCL49729.1 hypothetical protein O4O04_02600 [Leptospira sp. GIMC2001]
MNWDKADATRFILNVTRKKWVRVLFYICLIYNTVFNSITGQIVVDRLAQSILKSQLDINVTRFSLLYGFVFEDVILYSGDEFQKGKFLQSDRIAVTYNLPLLFLGRLKISEVSLTNSKIEFLERNKLWNFETIMEKSESSSIELEESEEQSGNHSDIISTFIPISLYANIFVNDLTIHVVRGMDSNDKLDLNLSDLNLAFELDSKRFREIPLSFKAINLIEKLEVSLNKDNVVPIQLKDSKDEIKFNLFSKFVLNHYLDKDIPKIESNLHLGTDEIVFGAGDNQSATAGIELKYDLKLDPIKDHLSLDELTMILAGKPTFQLDGEVQNISTPKMSFRFENTPTSIDLSEISKLFKKIPGLKNIALSGNISFPEIIARGDIDDLLTSIKIHGKNILVTLPAGKHSIPEIIIESSAHLNLSNPIKPTKENLLPILNHLSIEKISVQYNSIIAKISGEIDPNRKVELDLDISGINLEKFSNQVFGIASTKIRLRGDKLSLFGVDLKININEFRYIMGRGISGKNNIQLTAQKQVDLEKEFELEKIQITPLNFQVKNEKYEEFLFFTSNIGFSNLDSKLDFELKDLKIISRFTPMIPAMPVSLKSTVANLRESLGERLNLYGALEYLQSNSGKEIILHFGGSFPGIELDDLHIESDINILNDKPKTIEIKEFRIDAFKKKLYADFKGKFYKPFIPNPPYGDYTGSLAGKLRLRSKEPSLILKGINLKGVIDLDLDVQNEHINGKLHTEEADIRITSGNCPGANCKFTEIVDLFLDIPFHHNILETSTLVLTSGNKENLIKNYGEQKGLNFKIEKIRGSHPSLTGQVFDFVVPKDHLPGLSASIVHKDNILKIDNLRIFALDGIVYGRDILFNIGNGDINNMEFASTLQIRDVDLKQMLPRESQDKVGDGKIKADLNFTGRNLSDPIGNMNLYFSVFQIGSDFGKSAINIVSPTNLITDAIINSYSVNNVEIQLSKGLVYASIQFNKSLLNTLVFNIENDRIQEERIPLSSFLDRAKDEFSNYK